MIVILALWIVRTLRSGASVALSTGRTKFIAMPQMKLVQRECVKIYARAKSMNGCSDDGGGGGNDNDDGKNESQLISKNTHTIRL